MIRIVCIHYPDPVYQVILRKNGDQDILFDKSDRLRFSNLLQEGVRRLPVGTETNAPLARELGRVSLDLAEIQVSQAWPHYITS